ncbi:SigE family RNA polymerase sigma factor [Nocardioides stalactiti]|uniref:SigE family RNA polymerase sigma factor n=1 Tax=Nocardioides stalactiti TaxID=2755356 RepID=UPI001600DB67|nr:SigE family RNA polymerase sigma factor [Nocardioides stalactiti]
MAGDDGAFLDFVESRRTHLRATAYLMCGDWHQADDIVQEALIRLYVAWPRIAESASLNAYARRTIVNTALNQARKVSRREVPVAEVRDTAAPADGVDARLDIVSALDRLGSRQRACVVLRYFEDLPIDEVAHVLGCRPGTVKSQTARALVTLRTVLGAELSEIEGALS